MKNENEIQELDSERYTAIANELAGETFDFAIMNGGTNIPMSYLMEMFVMISSKIACDIIEEGDITKERILQIQKEMFEEHLEMFLEEHKKRSTDINVN